MRLFRRYSLLLMLAGICAAQDTNFQVGPQYLITTGSPMLLHPIVPPSLSLGETPAPVYIGETEIAPTPPAPSKTFLGGVYWGEHNRAEIVGRRLDTPSMTPSETALYMNEVANLVANASATTSAPPAEVPAAPSVVEITSAQLPANLPASLFDFGVTGTADSQFLRERGYGSSLGDIAAYWKAHKGHAPRTYTNNDLDRLHGR